MAECEIKLIAQVDDVLSLTAFVEDDRDALVAAINDQEIYDNTLTIPFPYRASDADTWLGLTARQVEETGIIQHFAVRHEGELIGSCGYQGLKATGTHRAEIGYWLARPFCGQGIMSRVVAAACRVGFQRYELHRIYAHVFDGNTGSMRVLEKSGFHKEGICRAHCRKGDRLIDTHLYSLLVSDPMPSGIE